MNSLYWMILNILELYIKISLTPQRPKGPQDIHKAGPTLDKHRDGSMARSQHPGRSSIPEPEKQDIERRWIISNTHPIHIQYILYPSVSYTERIHQDFLRRSESSHRQTVATCKMIKMPITCLQPAELAIRVPICVNDVNDQDLNWISWTLREYHLKSKRSLIPNSQTCTCAARCWPQHHKISSSCGNDTWWHCGSVAVLAQRNIEVEVVLVALQITWNLTASLCS